jgi:hypothetical protein
MDKYYDIKLDGKRIYYSLENVQGYPGCPSPSCKDDPGSSSLYEKKQ